MDSSERSEDGLEESAMNFKEGHENVGEGPVEVTCGKVMATDGVLQEQITSGEGGVVAPLRLGDVWSGGGVPSGDVETSQSGRALLNPVGSEDVKKEKKDHRPERPSSDRVLTGFRADLLPSIAHK